MATARRQRRHQASLLPGENDRLLPLVDPELDLGLVHVTAGVHVPLHVHTTVARTRGVSRMIVLPNWSPSEYFYSLNLVLR